MSDQPVKNLIEKPIPENGDDFLIEDNTANVTKKIGYDNLKTALNADLSFQAPIGFTPENAANKSTSVVTDQASNTKYPSVKAVYDWAIGAFQTALGFTPENVANKATNLTSPDNIKYPTTLTVSTALLAKQDSLGYTAENAANKENTTLDTSTTKYPTNNLVKTYVDTGLSGKQNSLGFTPENVANKSTTTSLGTSDTLYPTQNAVKVYADTKIAKDTGTTYTTDAVKTLTSAEYAAIPTPDASTLYFIV
jgi:hypothetical protein